MQPSKKQLEAVAKGWDIGDLSYALFDYQLPLYDKLWEFILDPSVDIGVINISRQWGKTYTTTDVFLEFGLRFKKKELHFLATDRVTLKDRVYKAINIILDGTTRVDGTVIPPCPWPVGDPRRPVFKGNTKDTGSAMLWFPTTGSKIVFFGLDGDKYRGGSPDLVNLDEAGFLKLDLEYAINDLIIPSFIQTRGTLIATSTPPKSSGNYYVKLAKKAEEKGTLVTFTAYDNTNIDRSKLEEIRRANVQADGTLSNSFRREYLAELITDASIQIIPAWKDEYIVGKEEYEAIKADPNYSAWKKFISIDYGTKDYTVIALYVWHYPTKRLIKEDEDWMQGAGLSVAKIVTSINALKQKTWNMAPAEWPDLVTGDVNTLVNQTLLNDHSVPMIPVRKLAKTKDGEGGKAEMVGKFNDLVERGGYGVVYTNTRSIACYQSGVWNSPDERGVKYARDKVLGHFDAIDSDVYLNLMAAHIFQIVPSKPQRLDLRTQMGPPEMINNEIERLNGRKAQSLRMPSVFDFAGDF